MNHKQYSHKVAIDVSIIKKMMETGGFSNPIISISEITNGMMNVTYKIVLEGQLGAFILRIRTFHDSEYGQEFTAERFAYYLTKEVRINTPKLYYVCTDKSIYGYPFAIFEFIEGDLLDGVLTNPKTSKSKRLKLLKDLGEILHEIHKIKGPGFGTITSIWFSAEERRNFWHKLFFAESEKLLNVDADLGYKYKELINTWLNYLETLPSDLGDPRLVHGDIQGRNIIVSKDNQLWLIDWEAARFRIAPYDFAQIKYLNLKNDPEGWSCLLNSYIKASGNTIKKEQIERAINICQFFWQLRMGLFQKEFPFGESEYFGNSKKHISEIKDFIFEEIRK